MGYLDRINVANARLAGMQDDLHMSDTTWSAGISLFYVGYIVTQLPATVYLAKGLPRWQMPAYVIAWSVITACMAAMTSGWSFLVCRFMVGVAEGPFLPMVSLMTSSWYTKEEAPLRMAIWHAGNICSNIFSGLLAAGSLENMNGLAGMRAWQWFVIIEGIVGLFVAVMGFWCIPNFPHNTGTYFMTPEMSEMAQYRMIVSAGGRSEDDEGGAWEDVKLTCQDPFTWIYTVLHFGLIVALSFKDFFPSIVKTLGYSNLMTYLIQAPPYVFAYIATCVISWSSGRYQEHCWHIVGSTVACIIGVVIMISTLNAGARYFGMFLLCAGPFVGLNVHIPWETTNVARPRTKRGALVAITNCIASVSHWFTPYFFTHTRDIHEHANDMQSIMKDKTDKLTGVSAFRRFGTTSPRPYIQISIFPAVTLSDRHNPHFDSGGPSTMQALACTLCHNRKVRCEVNSESNTCVTCKAAEVECIPRTRKRRRNTQGVSQPSRPGMEIPIDHATYQLQTPSTSQATTYIGRGHYVEDDNEIDETSARAFEPAKIKVGPHAGTQKETLVLWKAFDIPPLAARQSLLSAFLDYCNLWTPVLEPKDIQELSCFDQEKTSMLLAQSLWLAGSRVTNAPSVVAFASSDDFYHRAKAVFWSGLEADGVSAIKASLMLQWYNPQAPEHISFDNSGFWLKIGVGIAHQIGLHKESLPGPTRAIRRRLWWSLVVRDSLISVAHGRPRVINLDDSDVQPPIASDFPDSPSAFQLFSAWVGICLILGDISSCCMRRHMSRTKRLYIVNALCRWTTSLPQELRVAASNQPPHSYFANSHNLAARQLYLPYFTSLIVLSRMQHSAGLLSVTATLAASFVARIFEDFLARDEVKVLAPITRTHGAFQNAINKRRQRTCSSTAELRMDNKNSLEYFKMIDLGYCRIWSTLSQQLSSSPLAIQEQMSEPIQPLNDALDTNPFMDPGEACDMGTIQFEHVENWILNDGFLFDP
ncbi:hypothetical protein FAVG1_10152 [Fusarium avenaceum]|nr:hypothetical protein FAVG1_10152 [Fusarium avenaceum]